MNIQRKSIRSLGVAAVTAAALLAFTLNVDVTRPTAAPAGAGSVSIELSLGAKAHAFDPVSWVWEKFRKGVLEKVLNFIKSPIEKAKKGLKSLVDKAIAGLKKLFTDKVLTPALGFALKKIFPAADKVLNYAKQIIGKVDRWAGIAEKYAGAVDAMIMGQADKYRQFVGEANSSLDVIQKVNVSMVVDILIAIAKEKAAEFIKSSALKLLNMAYKAIETPINLGKAAACSAIGTIPIVGGILRGAVDFIITQGLVLLRDKGFEFLAEQAVKLGNMAIDAIGKKLKGVAAKVDTAIAPILNTVKGFIAKVAGYVAPLKNAFAKVKAGLAKAESTVASLKGKAEALAK